MKSKFLLIFFVFLFSCSAHLTTINSKPYTSTGFAYIYNDFDFKENYKRKMNNEVMQISHQNLKMEH